MSILAIIPARGGSKGIPKKNLMKVCGQSLVNHALNCISGSKYSMDVVVSTDSSEILENARLNGYSGEYLRPTKLAQDDSSMVEVVLDVLDWTSSRSKSYHVIVLLQPTSPLRSSGDLDASLKMFFAADNAKSLISVNSMYEHPVECIATNVDGWSYLVKPESYNTGRQSYNNDYFFINGAIYICTHEHLVQSGSLIENEKSLIYKMPRERSIDIDTEQDLMIANFLCKRV